MAEHREISEEYAAIGMALIANVEELKHLMGASIVFLRSNSTKKSKGKLVLGKCEKVQDKDKWAIPADFTVTVYDGSIKTLEFLNEEKFTQEQLVVLLYHELLHIGYDGEDKPMHTIPHDFSEFSRIIDRFGARWDREAPRDIYFLRDILEKAEMIPEKNASEE